MSNNMKNNGLLVKIIDKELENKILQDSYSKEINSNDFKWKKITNFLSTDNFTVDNFTVEYAEIIEQKSLTTSEIADTPILLYTLKVKVINSITNNIFERVYFNIDDNQIEGLND